MSSKYVDTTAIMQVIGNVFANPSLLDETDKYVLTDEGRAYLEQVAAGMAGESM